MQKINIAVSALLY